MITARLLQWCIDCSVVAVDLVLYSNTVANTHELTSSGRETSLKVMKLETDSPPLYWVAEVAIQNPDALGVYRACPPQE